MSFLTLLERFVATAVAWEAFLFMMASVDEDTLLALRAAATRCVDNRRVISEEHMAQLK
jgi:hypothetical protein